MQGVVNTILAAMENAGAFRVTNVQLAVGTSGHFTPQCLDGLVNPPSSITLMVKRAACSAASC